LRAAREGLTVHPAKLVQGTEPVADTILVLGVIDLQDGLVPVTRNLDTGLHRSPYRRTGSPSDFGESLHH
jgi:hypothetical protein